MARVLIVDDDLTLLDAFSKTLKRSGYEAIPAEGPRQALEIIRSQPHVDVVLSDVVMPEMRGTELVREIGQLSPDSACVLMSAGVVPRSELPPDVPLLRKPLLKDDLLAAVDQALIRASELHARLQAAMNDSAALQRRAKRLLAESQELRRKIDSDRQSRFSCKKKGPGR